MKLARALNARVWFKRWLRLWPLGLLGVLAASVAAQTLTPPMAVNPWLGWSWQKTPMASLDPARTVLTLHHKLQKSAQAPAVLIGHDNGGISDNELRFAEHVFEQGFHVFIHDRVSARNRVATPLEKTLVEDTFAAVAFIKKQFAQQIQTDRVSYVSFSGDGGFAGLMAIEPKARLHFSQSDPEAFKFHRVVAIYPHCLNMVSRQPDTPTLIIGAELDGSDPVVCQNVYARFPVVQVTVFPGAFHGFDQAGVKQKTWINKPVTMPGQCEWTLDLDTPHDRQGKRYFMLSTPDGFAQNTPEFGRYNATCNTQKAGYFSEYRADLTRQAYEKTLAFLRH